MPVLKKEYKQIFINKDSSSSVFVLWPSSFVVIVKN
jgi:hypothetical protein